MEAIADQLAELGGSSAALGLVRGGSAHDDGPALRPCRPLRTLPAELPPAKAEHAGFGPASQADSGPAQSVPAEFAPPGSARGREPLGLAEIGRLLAEAAASAPSILAGADYVEAANYAGQVEELSRGVEYLQVLSAGTVDRTRTQAIAAADAARTNRSRTGKTWVTGWDNGVETLNETDTNWPGGSTPSDTATGNGTGTGNGNGTGTAGASESRVITSPADDGCANTAEFLRQRLRIGKSEANRRLALAADILPATTLTGDTIPAPREHLAAALTPTPASTGTPNTEGTTGTDTVTDAGPDSEDTVGAGDGVEGTAAACPAVSSRAGTIIALTLDRLQHLTTPEKLALIEENLTTTAATADPDFLARVARRWADTIDADGTEPSEEALRHTQGAFIRKPRHGLHHLEIFATTDQYEHLLTVMNTATNPRTTTPATGPTPESTTADASGTNRGGTNDGRTGEEDRTTEDGVWTDNNRTDNNPGPDLDRRTRPQKQLDGLVGAAKVALATNTLPTTGGNRPQIIATINYQDLLPHHHSATTGADTGAWNGRDPGRGSSGSGSTITPPGPASNTGTTTGTGNFVFTGPVAATTLRKIACDADIIPALLGTHGELLDLGRKTRLFTPAQRTALTARDQGCAFPNCTIPAPWCEAHHITYWSQDGPTNLNNGVLLCSAHHHLIHKEQWTITTTNNTPWFTPPKHLDPHQKPQQNHYFKPPPPPTQRE
jgi:hypothetical protein